MESELSKSEISVRAFLAHDAEGSCLNWMALLQMHSDPRVSAKATTLLQTYFVAQAGPALAMAEQWKDERKQRFESIVPQKPLAEALYQSKARAVMSVQKIANQCLKPLKDMFESVNEDVTDFQSIDFADLVAGLAGSAMDCLEVILKVEDAVTEIAKEPRRRPPRNISMCKAGIFQELMVLKRRNWNFETTEQSSRILERLMSNKNMHQNIVGLWYEEESSSPKSVDRKGCPIEA